MRRSAYIFLPAFVAVGGPLLAYGLRFGLAAPIYLFSADAFYYLDIAKHSLGTTGFTFDGLHQTNGFHPLWEWLLLCCAKLHLLHFADKASALLRVYYLNVLILSLASAAFCVAAARHMRKPWLAFLTVAPGLFWPLAAMLEPEYYSTWTYTNGMESALALLCFATALLLYRASDANLLRTAAISCALGLCVLARLDDAFIAAAVIAWMLLRTPQERRPRITIALSPAVLMVLAYVLYNRTHAGSFLPSSGVIKANFALLENLRWTARLFLPVLTGDHPTAFRTAINGYTQISEVGGRIFQMVFPAAVCAAEICLRWRRSRSLAGFNILHALCLGVITKAAYNFIMVRTLDQGQWYYTVSVAICNLILVLWLERVLQRLWPATGARIYGRLPAVACVLWSLFACDITFARRNDLDRASKLLLLHNADPLNSKLRSMGAAGFVELDDGFIGYVADTPSIGGIGLVLDREAGQAFRSGTFLQLAYARGDRAVVTESVYDLFIQRDLELRRQGKGNGKVFTLQASEFDRYSLDRIGTDGTADNLVYYRIVPLSAR